MFIALAVAGLQGCASLPGAEQRAETVGVTIAGMVIRNELMYGVTDVMINVPATGAFAGCGNIMSRSECRISFEAVDYSGHPVAVSWKEYGEPQQTDEFLLETGSDIDPGRAAWLEVIIFARGQAGANLIQE
jgi:uncharacterized protein YceK